MAEKAADTDLLEALEVGLSIGQIDVPRATSEYMKCLEETAFLESR